MGSNSLIFHSEHLAKVFEILYYYTMWFQQEAAGGIVIVVPDCIE